MLPLHLLVEYDIAGAYTRFFKTRMEMGGPLFV
jgi:hypothetical protein